jgi:hypothetical protein
MRSSIAFVRLAYNVTGEERKQISTYRIDLYNLNDMSSYSKPSHMSIRSLDLFPPHSMSNYRPVVTRLSSLVTP